MRPPRRHVHYVTPRLEVAPEAELLHEPRPVRARRDRELVLGEVAHEVAQEIEEALHFFVARLDDSMRHASRRGAASTAARQVLEMTNFGLEPPRATRSKLAHGESWDEGSLLKVIIFASLICASSITLASCRLVSTSASVLLR